MKSIRITFRLSPYQLARGLQTIRQLEPSYKLISLNDLAKTIYHDYLAKMTLNKLDVIPDNIMSEIMSFINSPAQSQITLQDLMEIKSSVPKPKLVSRTKAKPIREPEPAQELEPPPKILELSDEIRAEINKLVQSQKASTFSDPNKSDSDISTLTDFSPPKDWMD